MQLKEGVKMWYFIMGLIGTLVLTIGGGKLWFYIETRFLPAGAGETDRYFWGVMTFMGLFGYMLFYGNYPGVAGPLGLGIGVGVIVFGIYLYYAGDSGGNLSEEEQENQDNYTRHH